VQTLFNGLATVTLWIYYIPHPFGAACGTAKGSVSLQLPVLGYLWLMSHIVVGIQGTDAWELHESCNRSTY
jgi:hypothetical protein